MDWIEKCVELTPYCLIRASRYDLIFKSNGLNWGAAMLHENLYLPMRLVF